MSDRLAIVRSIFVDFLARGSLEALMAHVAEDVVYQLSYPPGTPLGAEHRGPQGVADYFALADSLLETLSLETHDFLEGGDKVVVLGHERVRVRATGEEFESPWCTVFTFRDGRIGRIAVIEDLAVLYAAERRP